MQSVDDLSFQAFREATESLLVHAAAQSGWRIVRRVPSPRSASLYLHLVHEASGRRVTVRISDHSLPGRGWGASGRRLEIHAGRAAAGIGAVFRRLHKAAKDAKALVTS